MLLAYTRLADEGSQYAISCELVICKSASSNNNILIVNQSLYKSILDSNHQKH